MKNFKQFILASILSISCLATTSCTKHKVDANTVAITGITFEGNNMKTNPAEPAERRLATIDSLNESVNDTVYALDKNFALIEKNNTYVEFTVRVSNPKVESITKLELECTDSEATIYNTATDSYQSLSRFTVNDKIYLNWTDGSPVEQTFYMHVSEKTDLSTITITDIQINNSTWLGTEQANNYLDIYKYDRFWHFRHSKSVLAEYSTYNFYAARVPSYVANLKVDDEDYQPSYTITENHSFKVSFDWVVDGTTLLTREVTSDREYLVPTLSSSGKYVGFEYAHVGLRNFATKLIDTDSEFDYIAPTKVYLNGVCYNPSTESPYSSWDLAVIWVGSSLDINTIEFELCNSKYQITFNDEVTLPIKLSEFGENDVLKIYDYDFTITLIE